MRDGWAPALLSLLALSAASGCVNNVPCECVGSLPGGAALAVACGGTQCVGGVLYACTGPSTVEIIAGGCGGPRPNPRPAGTPDFMIVAVSGHEIEGVFSREYLLRDGTVDAIAAPLLARGFAVNAIATTDSFYDAPAGDGAPVARGFLWLVDELAWVRDTLIADYDNPTLVIVVAHSHGAVWAHTALHVLEQAGAPLPVDFLVDLDGVSVGWERDEFLDFGDSWSSVIVEHERRTGATWPFAISNAADSWTVPRVATLQDVEDVVPDSVIMNLEVVSNSDGLIYPSDTEVNRRRDGGVWGILDHYPGEAHTDVDAASSAAVRWVVGEIRAAYGL